MDQASLSSFDALPAEVQRLLSIRGPLDAGQANLLSVYLAQNAATLDPQIATMIGAKIGSAPTDWRAEVASVPAATAPSVPDQVTAAQAVTPTSHSPFDAIGALISGAGTTIGSMPDPVGAVLPTIPGLSDTGRAILSGQEIPATGPVTSGPGDDLRAEADNPGGGPRLSPELPAATPPQDFIGRTATAVPQGGDLGGVGANPLPDRGGGNDRAGERGARTNWKVEADELGGRLPEESAFADVASGMLPTVEADPRIAANLIARQRGAGDRGGALIAPQLEQLLDLNRAGMYGGTRGVGPQAGLQSSGDRLRAAEDLYTQLGPGSYLDPQTLHRQTLRNIRRTDATAMFGGEGGTAGDINNQIAVTNDALVAAAAASMAPDSLAAMEARLHSAEQEYIMGVVDGSIVPSQLSYPQWLRTEKQVRKWVGPGTTSGQWQQAFSTD